MRIAYRVLPKPIRVNAQWFRIRALRPRWRGAFSVLSAVVIAGSMSACGSGSTNGEQGNPEQLRTTSENEQLLRTKGKVERVHCQRFSAGDFAQRWNCKVKVRGRHWGIIQLREGKDGSMSSIGNPGVTLN